MTQKQIVSVFVGVVIVILLGVFVYMQFTSDTRQAQTPNEVRLENAAVPSDSRTVKQEPVPESIDAITESIFVESSVDTSALDAEAEGEAAEIDADNESVNNLENSYDENNL